MQSIRKMLMMGGNSIKPGKYNWIYLVVLVCSIAACKKKEAAPPEIIRPPFVPNGPSAILRMLALGDSYTIGQGVAFQDRFPHQTVAILKQQNRSFADPEYIAQTGWTTYNLLQGIMAANRPRNYDVVTLCIGVNNQYQGKDTTTYKQEFAQCLQQAIAHAGERKQRVFVLSIPDYGVTPFGRQLNPEKIAREINYFNHINQRLSQEYGVYYIEITTGSRDAANDPSLVATDGLHPSAKEYSKWAEKLSVQILHALR